MISRGTFKNYSYCCVGGSHHSSTTNVEPVIPFYFKTGEENAIFKCECSVCKKTQTKTVSDKTIKADMLENFKKTLRESSVEAANFIVNKVANNPTKAIEFAADVSYACATRNLKALAAIAFSI